VGGVERVGSDDAEDLGVVGGGFSVCGVCEAGFEVEVDGGGEA